MYKILNNIIEMDDYSLQRLVSSKSIIEYIWYKIWGNTVQSGSPTPSIPVEVKGVGDKSKNLLPIAGMGDRKISGVNFIDNNDGTIIAKGTSTDRYSQLSITIPSNIFGNVVVSGCPENGSTAKYDIYCWDSDTNSRPKNWQGSSSLSDFGSGTEVTFVKGHDNRLVIRVYGDFAKDDLIFKPMIRQAGTTPDFEPYFDNFKISIICDNDKKYIYLNDQLQKIGDYADILSYSTHSCERKIKKMVLTGNENITTSSVSSDIFFVEANNVVVTTNIITVKCTHYETVANSSVRNLNVNQMNCSPTVQNRIAIRCEYTTIADLRNFLTEQYANGTPVTIWYVLETPETEQIKAPDILSDKYTSIAVDTEVQPSQVDFTTKGRHIPQPSLAMVRKMNAENNSKTNDEEVKSIEEKEEIKEPIEKEGLRC